MLILYALLLLMLLFVVVPFLRWVFTRVEGMLSIKRLCKQNKFILHQRSKLWFWGMRNSAQCDCAIETPDAVYVIKLFGVAQRHATLVLLDEAKYLGCRMFAMLLHVRFSFDATPVPFPAYDFHTLYQQSSRKKECRKVLLVHPKPLNIVLRNREQQDRPFRNGDCFCGMEIMTLRDLLELLAVPTQGA
ncbi:MAG: hypothetical protein J6K13_04710 [Clostridia bacterium]|nr:hypothetical protein [Clostridia bacterium]